jgi:hypothetical protein
MNVTVQQKLARSLDVLIGGEGSLPFRLFCLGSLFNEVSPDEFSSSDLRRRFLGLRDSFAMMGFLDGTEGSPWDDLTEDDAMILAIKILDFYYRMVLLEFED